METDIFIVCGDFDYVTDKANTYQEGMEANGWTCKALLRGKPGATIVTSMEGDYNGEVSSNWLPPLEGDDNHCVIIKSTR